MKGLDLEMYNEFCDICDVPLIVGGGVNGEENLKQFKRPIDAISASSLFHYRNFMPNDLKKIYKK